MQSCHRCPGHLFSCHRLGTWETSPSSRSCVTACVRRNHEEQGRLSKRSCTLCLHELSYMGAREAVQTSQLSKTWEHEAVQMSSVFKCLSIHVMTASTRGCTEVTSFQLRIYAGADCTLVACCDSCQAQSCNLLSRGDGAGGGGGRSVIVTASDAAASFRGEMRRWRRRQRFRDRERCLMTSLGCKQTWQHLLIMSIPLSLGAFVSPSPFLFLCRRFVPPCPILLSSVSCCSLSCCLRVLFLHTLSSLSFLLSVVVASLSCALRCRGMRTCQRTHASLLHYYCNLLTTSASDLAHGMCMECRISPRVHRRNVLRVPAEHLSLPMLSMVPSLWNTGTFC